MEARYRLAPMVSCHPDSRSHSRCGMTSGDYFVLTTVSDTVAGKAAPEEVGVIVPLVPDATPNRRYAALPPFKVSESGVPAVSVRVVSGYGGGFVELTNTGRTER